MKKFIIHSTRWVKNGRKVGYFRDHNELVEIDGLLDNILDHIRKNYIMAFGVVSQKRTFCSATEVEDYLSISYKYIEKDGGLHIGRGDDDAFVLKFNNGKHLTKYDFKLKGWME